MNFEGEGWPSQKDLNFKAKYSFSPIARPAYLFQWKRNYVKKKKKILTKSGWKRNTGKIVFRIRKWIWLTLQ